MAKIIKRRLFFCRYLIHGPPIPLVGPIKTHNNTTFQVPIRFIDTLLRNLTIIKNDQQGTMLHIQTDILRIPLMKPDTSKMAVHLMIRILYFTYERGEVSGNHNIIAIKTVKFAKVIQNKFIFLSL